MNLDVYNYVNTISKRIKNKPDIPDVQQEVLLILCNKDLINKPLDNKLKNYIKGIVFNYSTTLYKSFNWNVNSLEGLTIVDLKKEVTSICDSDAYKDMIFRIRRYVFENYYLVNKKITRWKVFYLYFKSYSYKEIAIKLNITYHTAIEYNYKCIKELKEKLILN
ncbi:hypothetical protein SAMN04488057_117109 [Cyclobacterium lianum]|uniref:Uncharacterized protein n=1 Tax=Cyclobacterium lianum TaxID=388280 RepID=A0A1M7QFN1_9BACT|nr:sigma-70 family RNA polymerase sigma factor [Cyclobacterium lianum]SHN29847.1 hypothetical protein SAMN04488057_117109 [Cyclobacterium lianum]